MMIPKAARTQIIELCRTTDLSVTAIAKTVGVCPDTVKKVIRDYKPDGVIVERPRNPHGEKECELCGAIHANFIEINQVGWVPCLKTHLEKSQVFRY